SGDGHTCAAMTSAKYVKCWGSQYFGQLGNGVASTDSALNPVDWSVPSWADSTKPQTTALSAGGAHTCAIISTYVECWGWNDYGQLGNNGVTGSTSTWIG